MRVIMRDVNTNVVRINSIDRVRGFAIFYMIWFQFLMSFDNLPILPKLGIHAPDINGVYLLPDFTCADIIAPLFLLAIGFTYSLSFNRSANKYDLKITVKKFVKRYTSLVGIGILLDGINAIIDGKKSLVDIIISGITLFFYRWDCFISF